MSRGPWWRVDGSTVMRDAPGLGLQIRVVGVTATEKAACWGIYIWAWDNTAQLKTWVPLRRKPSRRKSVRARFPEGSHILFDKFRDAKTYANKLFEKHYAP